MFTRACPSLVVIFIGWTLASTAMALRSGSPPGQDLAVPITTITEPAQPTKLLTIPGRAAWQIGLANYSGVDDDWLRQDLVASAPTEWLVELAQHRYAPVVWADIIYGNKSRYCFATAWLAPSSEQPPRIASTRIEHLIAMTEDDDEEECRRQASHIVLAQLLATPLAIARMSADDTQQGRPRGRALDPAMPGKISMTILGPPSARAIAEPVVADILQDKLFLKNFDYREHQIVVMQAQFRTKTAALCVAVTGLTSAPPRGFASRLPNGPGSSVASRELADLDRAGQQRELNTCIADAASQATESMRKKALLADSPFFNLQPDNVPTSNKRN